MPPEAEVEIDLDLVARLLHEQAPELSGEPLSVVASGWDNLMVRAGPKHAVRLPRRTLAAELVRNEAAWLPVLAPRLPLPVPAPVLVGAPTPDYPFPWTVVPWFEGQPVHGRSLLEPTAAVRALSEFLGALHVEAPAEAPPNPYRGGPLADRDELTRRRLERGSGDLEAAGVSPSELSRAWGDAVGLPPHEGPPTWIHGDLHPLNLVALDAELRAVVDFGDITAGDPATDLLVAWYVFDPDHRESFRSELGLGGPRGASTWGRGAGWALSHALAVLESEPWDSPLGILALGAIREVLAERP